MEGTTAGSRGKTRDSLVKERAGRVLRPYATAEAGLAPGSPALPSEKQRRDGRNLNSPTSVSLIAQRAWWWQNNAYLTGFWGLREIMHAKVFCKLWNMLIFTWDGRAGACLILKTENHIKAVRTYCLLYYEIRRGKCFPYFRMPCDLFLFDRMLPCRSKE